MKMYIHSILFNFYIVISFVEARLNSNKLKGRSLQSTSNNDLNIFKTKHNILKDANIPIQTVSSSNSLQFQGKTYYLNDDSYQPVQVFSNHATYTLDGVDGPLPSSYIFQKQDSHEIVTITKNIEQKTQTVTIVNKKDRRTAEMSEVTPGVFATTQAEDYDYININSKYHYGDTDVKEKVIFETAGNHNIQSKTSSIQSPCTSYKELEVAIAYDSSFCSDLGSSSNADEKVMSLITAVSDKYRQDGVCVEVVISHLEGHCDSNNDPYKEFVSMNLSGCGNVGLLTMVKNYWMENKSDIHRDAVLFFSGTGLECTDEDTCMIGCAYRGSICNQDYGFAVNHVTFTEDFNLQATLVAHELGHTCGASHQDEHDFVMTPEINLGTNGFSAESIERMNGVFASTQCLSEVSNLVSQNPTSSPIIAPSLSIVTSPSGSSNPLNNLILNIITLASTPKPSPYPSSAPSISSTEEPRFVERFTLCFGKSLRMFNF